MYQYQYDPLSGLWMLVALAALVSAFVVGPVCYLLGRRHGRLQAQPIARFLPGETVLQPGYGMAAPEPLDELDVMREKMVHLRNHPDVASAHENGNYWRE